MAYNVPNFKSIIVCILIYSSYTYGLTWESAPTIPPESTKFNCEGWIRYHGFTATNVKLNRKMALDRNKNNDKVNSVWAALYAYFMSSFNELSLKKPNCCSPLDFCNGYAYSSKENSYLALKDAEMTCEEWIYSYGFIGMPAFNFVMAKSRKKADDRIMHIWVAMYARYMEDRRTANLQPAEFCWNVGKFFIPRSRKLPFVNLDTTKSCKEWIELSDYDDDVDNNIQKALVLNTDFEPYISKWTVLYIDFLKETVETEDQSGYIVQPLDSQNLTPAAYCDSIGKLFGQEVYFDKYFTD